MGTFANPETLFDNSTNGPTVEQALQQMRDNQRAIMELEGAKPTEVCTISTTNINTNGTIYPSCAEVVVTLPENTDNLSAVLTDISPSYERTTGVYEMLHDGMVVSLKSEFNSYQIELVSSETLRLKTAERITLSHLYPLKLKLVLGNNGDYYWEEVPSAGTHSGDITSISGDLDVSGKIRSNGALLEKKLAFDSTPVYSMTLAEDTSVSSANPIEITDAQLGGDYTDLILFIVSPQPAVTTPEYTVYTVYMYFYLDSDETIFVKGNFQLNSTYTAGCWNRVDVFEHKGMMNCTRAMSGQDYSVGAVYQFPQIGNTPFINGHHITKIKIGNIGSSVTIPAGTTITIYAAKEVQ